MKKVLFFTIFLSSVLFANRSLDNLIYVTPGMTMEEVHKKIDKPYKVRGTKTSNEGKVLTIHQHYLIKSGKITNTTLISGISGALYFGILGALESAKTGIESAIIGGGISAIIGFFVSKGPKEGEVYWMFYEDNKLTFFCKPGDWETTAPRTVKVQWEDIEK